MRLGGWKWVECLVSPRHLKNIAHITIDRAQQETFMALLIGDVSL
jgi:hypothetical protein